MAAKPRENLHRASLCLIAAGQTGLTFLKWSTVEERDLD